MTVIDRRNPARKDAAVQPLSTSVIIPFQANLHQLNRCLACLQPLPPRTEIIVAADRAPRECERVAYRHGARIVQVSGPGGPAAARNQAAAQSRSDVLIFIDADVAVPSSALHAMVREFSTDPTLGGLFGSCDDDPGCRHFFSQYKKLTHAYAHRSSGRVARSFRSGFGGMRSEAFHSVGGFDEAFTAASIEDIELGERVTTAGHLVLIDRRLHGCHLKRWTFRSMLASDVWDRGVPWTQLILKSRRVHDVNVVIRPAISVALCYTVLLCLALAYWQPELLFAAAAAIASVLFLNRKLYLFFAAERGAWFACRAMLMNLLDRVCNGVSFVLGAALFLSQRATVIPQPRHSSDSSNRVAMR